MTTLNMILAIATILGGIAAAGSSGTKSSSFSNQIA